MITFVLMYTYSTHKRTCIKYAFIIVILSNSLHIKPQRNLPTQLRALTMSLYMQVCKHIHAPCTWSYAPTRLYSFTNPPGVL